MPLVVKTVLPTAEKKKKGWLERVTSWPQQEGENIVLFLFFCFVTFFFAGKDRNTKRMGTLINLWLEAAALQHAPMAQQGRTVPSEPIAHAEDQVVGAESCGVSRCHGQTGGINVHVLVS